MFIAIDPSGHFAYVANNADGTISQYSIGTDGALTPVGTPKRVTGNGPSVIAIDPSGQFAYVVSGPSKSLPEIASRFGPKAVISGAGGPSVGYFALAAIPARYALERRDWKQAVQLALREIPFSYADAMTWFARGLGAARLGQAAAADESTTALQQIRVRLLKANENYWARHVQIQELAVRAWAALAEGKEEKALRQMESASELEDGTEKSAVTPGPLAPARVAGRDAAGDDEPAQVQKQFEATLKKEPGRLRSLYGAAHAAQLSGSRDTSQKYFHEIFKVCAHADKPGRSEVLEAQRAILQN